MRPRRLELRVPADELRRARATLKRAKLLVSIRARLSRSGMVCYELVNYADTDSCTLPPNVPLSQISKCSAWKFPEARRVPQRSPHHHTYESIGVMENMIRRHGGHSGGTNLQYPLCSTSTRRQSRSRG
jgi:hypothetical protein